MSTDWYILCILYIVCKSFYTTFDKGLRKNNNKKEMEKLKNKLNEMGALNMTLKK